MIGLRAFGLALRSMWEEFYIIVATAIAGFLCTFLVILAPLAWMGYYVLAQRIAAERVVSWEDWWHGARQHWRIGYLWAAINLSIIFLILFNMNFYAEVSPGQWGSLLAGIWLTILVFWLGVQLYVLPFYLAQEDRRLRVALRNAALVAITDPLTTLALLVLSIFLAAIMYVIAWPLLLLLPPYLALVGTHTVRLRLIQDGLLHPDDPPQK